MLNKSNVIVTLLRGVFEYLLLFPLLLIISMYVVDEQQMWIWLGSLFGLFVVGVLFKTLFFEKKWWLYIGFSLLIGIFPSLLFAENLVWMIFLFLIHPAFIYRGMMYVGRSWDDLLPVSFLWLGGFGIYFISYFLFRYIELLHPYLSLITLCGALLVVMTLFISNSDHLKSSTLSKEKQPFISRAIKNQNRIFLILTLVVIAVITNGKTIRDAIWNAFRSFLQWIFSPGTGGEEQIIEEPPPPSSMVPDFPNEEPKEPSVIAEILETIMMYVVYLILIVVAIVVVLLLIKKTRAWVKRIFSTFIQFLKGIVNKTADRVESAEYIDEKESVFSWQEWKEEQQAKAKGFMQNIFKREPSWDSLSKQEKVRFVYRKFLLQEVENIDYNATNTPRETLEDIITSMLADEKLVEKLRVAYEQSRYGEQDVAKDKIQEIYALIEKR